MNDAPFLAGHSTERILLIHNHPKSGVSSIVDLNELLTHKNAVGITVGHNGNIYYYTKPKQIVTDFDFYVALRKSKAYNTDMAYEEALSELAKQFKFEFRKL